MSTRATYKFHSTNRQQVTVYIHQDGYPEGAAQYIRNASEIADQSKIKKISAKNFIRHNEDAMITDNHKVHGDTEYMYDFFSDGGIKCIRRHIDYDPQTEKLDVFFTNEFEGTIGEFMDKYFYIPQDKAI